jgi:polysaccharide export outer membrane protein
MVKRVVLCWVNVAMVLLMAFSGAVADPNIPQAGYRIGPNDVIRIQVFGEDDLTLESRVGGDGKLNYPLLGVLHVGGQTTEDLQADLTKRLSAGYVRSPKVTVSIVRHRNVYVSGEVKAPGGFAYEDGLTAQKAITMAGGFTEKAAKNSLTVTRRKADQDEIVNAQLHTPLFPDDTIVVGQVQKFYLMGEVTRPGSYPYPFEEQLTANKAVSLAGGFTEKAEKQALKVTRVTESGAQTIALGVDDVILPNDILSVSTQNRKFYISGEVRTPGAYPYNENISLQKALAMAGGATEKADRQALTVRRVVEGQEQSLVLPLEAAVQPEDLIIVREGQRVYVTGEVKTPGRYAYETGATIQRVLTLAGGVTEKAEASVVKLTRTTEQGVETTVVPQDAVVLPEDIILVVPKSDKFYVSGEVKNPGSYTHKEGLSLQKALAMAGGVTEKGDVERLQLVRIVNNQEEHPVVTLESPVMPEDTIVVAERQKLYVTGEVRTPGRHTYEAGISVQKAISMAGGFTEKADKTDVRVERRGAQGVTTLQVDPNAPLQPDDLLVIPQARRFYVNGEVKKPGDFWYERGLTLHMAITMAGGFTEKASKTPKVLRKVNGQERTVELALDAPILPDDIIVVSNASSDRARPQSLLKI